MKVLITGGAGFIGSHLTDQLLKEGKEVVIIDNLSTGKIENLIRHENNERLTFIKADITNREKIRESMENVQRVIHEAAVTSVPLSIKKPGLTERVNIEGTRILLEESARNNVKKFIIASSCAVYGKAKEIPICEDAELNPISPYGESKLEAERLCGKFSKVQGLDTACLRYFNVYGPRQSYNPYAGVILKFIRRLKEGKPPVIFGDGGQTRDFIQVRDIVKGTLLALKRENLRKQVFNIGSGSSVSINKLCAIIRDILDSIDIKPIYKEAKSGDIRHSRADLDRAREILGFEPEISINEGLSDLLEKIEK